MQLSEFDFPFDASLIATEPVLPRDQARLLVLSPRQQSMTHGRIAEAVLDAWGEPESQR